MQKNSRTNGEYIMTEIYEFNKNGFISIIYPGKVLSNNFDSSLYATPWDLDFASASFFNLLYNTPVCFSRAFRSRLF